MRRLIVPLLLLACIPCDTAPGVVQHGDAPAGAEAVLAVAAERCALDGLTVRWVEDGRGYAGVRVPVACGAWVDVEIRAPAWESALAHEIAHVCGAESEGEADAWAGVVNAEAAGR